MDDSSALTRFKRLIALMDEIAARDLSLFPRRDAEKFHRMFDVAQAMTKRLEVQR